MGIPPGQPAALRGGEFQSASQVADVSFQLKEVAPPSPIYVGRDDQLIIRWVANNTAITLNVAARLLLANGNIVPIVLQFVAANAYITQTNTIQLAEGYLLSLGISGNNASVRGTCFAKAFLSRAGQGAAQGSYPLVADYVTSQASIGWPAGRVISPNEGPGAIRAVQVTNPAAGADWTLPMNNGTRVRIASVQARLITSAAVANRNVQLILQEGNLLLPFYTGVANATIPASTTAQVVGTTSQPSGTLIGTVVTVPLPATPIITTLTSETLQSVTQNIQAADQWSNIVVGIEEWFDF